MSGLKKEYVDNQEKSLEKSKAIVNYISMMISLAKDNGMKKRDLVNWIHSKFYQYGYFHEKELSSLNATKLEDFVENFKNGRELLYEDVEVIKVNDYEYLVKSYKWYIEESPESFFYFDITPEEFSEYAILLASINAKKSGISIKFSQEQNGLLECAHIMLSENVLHFSDPMVISATREDNEFLKMFFDEHWGGTKMISKGIIYNAIDENVLLYKAGNDIKGVLVFTQNKDFCEILTLEALEKFHGIGSKLLSHLELMMLKEGITKIKLITSNDNLDAMRFYQRKGFSFKSIYKDAIREARILKPEIPYLGNNDIEIKDEIEFEKEISS